MNVDLLKVDFSKYESPIQKIVGKAIEEMQTRMIQQEEDRLIMECRETVGFYINKDELIRALNYDRDQYAKGYKAGLNADRWISVKDQLPEESGRYLAYIVNRYVNGIRYIMTAEYFSKTKEWVVDDDCSDNNVVAWQPLPNPPKVGDEDDLSV